MATKSNPKKKEKYAAQKQITEKNRKLKRERHMKKYPNDMQTKAALEKM